MKTRKFRQYETTPKHCIKELYRKQRLNQNLEYVKRMHKQWCKFNDPSKRLTIKQAMEKLANIVDKSDPDINVGNLYHLYQTAEGIRDAGLPDWMQLVGLLHDLGKVMYIWGCDQDGTSNDEQWGVVGDTFIVGCCLPNVLVHSEFNNLCIDHKKFDEIGIYSEKCGLNNVLCSWGHDEYLYQVLKNNPTKLPLQALQIIRFHSLYAWHTHGAYKHFENEQDCDLKLAIRKFNQFDLYTKTDDFDSQTLSNIQEYYDQLIEKYFGVDQELQW